MADQRMVRQFHDRFGARVNEPVTRELILERWALISEEFVEFATEWLGLQETALPARLRTMLRTFTAWVNVDRHDTAAAMGEASDLMYVLYGAAVNVGAELDWAFEITHDSNMSKVGEGGIVAKNGDGKILKPPGHAAPNYDVVLRYGFNAKE